MTTEREWTDETPPPRIPDGGQPARGGDWLAALALLLIAIGFTMTAFERMFP